MSMSSLACATVRPGRPAGEAAPAWVPYGSRGGRRGGRRAGDRRLQLCRPGGGIPGPGLRLCPGPPPRPRWAARSARRPLQGPARHSGSEAARDLAGSFQPRALSGRPHALAYILATSTRAGSAPAMTTPHPRAHGAFMRPPPCAVRPSAWGNGLFATRSIDKGEVIFTERPLVAHQEITNSRDIPACWACMMSYAKNPHGADLPLSHHWPEFTPVRCSGGCGALFCHSWCERQAKKEGHSRLCAGQAAVKDLVEYCESEVPPEWSEVRHAPLVAARLMSAILEEGPSAGPGGVAGMCARLHGDWGRVASGLEATFDLKPLYGMVEGVLGLTAEEKAWSGFSVEYLGELLSKIFLNIAHVKPQSCFAQYFTRSRRDRMNCDTDDDNQRNILDEISRLTLQKMGDGREGGDGVALKASDMDAFYARLTGSSCGAVFDLHSKINHSCDNNAAALSGVFTNSSIDVVALREIRIGEEILISYCDTSLPRGERQKMLLECHFFECKCSKCAAEE